jgi:hypothetical protein
MIQIKTGFLILMRIAPYTVPKDFRVEDHSLLNG